MTKYLFADSFDVDVWGNVVKTSISRHCTAQEILYMCFLLLIIHNFLNLVLKYS